MITPEQRQAALEKQIQLLTTQVQQLNKRITFLERENNRRKLEIQSKKG